MYIFYYYNKIVLYINLIKLKFKHILYYLFYAQWDYMSPLINYNTITMKRKKRQIVITCTVMWEIDKNIWKIPSYHYLVIPT